MIVVVREALFSESVPQSDSSREEGTMEAVYEARHVLTVDVQTRGTNLIDAKTLIASLKSDDVQFFFGDEDSIFFLELNRIPLTLLREYSK